MSWLIFFSRLFLDRSLRKSITSSTVGIVPVGSRWRRLRNSVSFDCLDGFMPSCFNLVSMWRSRCLVLDGFASAIGSIGSTAPSHRVMRVIRVIVRGVFMGGLLLEFPPYVNFSFNKVSITEPFKCNVFLIKLTFPFITSINRISFTMNSVTQV